MPIKFIAGFHQRMGFSIEPYTGNSKMDTLANSKDPGLGAKFYIFSVSLKNASSGLE